LISKAAAAAFCISDFYFFISSIKLLCLTTFTKMFISLIIHLFVYFLSVYVCI